MSVSMPHPSVALQISSDAVRDDPSMTRTLRKQYARQLVKSFSTAKGELQTALSDARTLERELAPSPFDVEAFMADAGRILARTVIAGGGPIPFTGPGVQVAEDNAGRAYRAGGMRASQFMGGIGIDIEAATFFSPVDRETLNIINQRNFSALKGITDETEKVIRREITDGVARGEGIGKLSVRLRDSVDNIGITRARTMARTETIYAFNTAAKNRYEQYGIRKVEWLTAPVDACPICAPLNGNTYPINSAPDIPAHPNCRCVLLPVGG
jgi:SPP1 gp7 family putative phage head morphogenesis protein